MKKIIPPELRGKTISNIIVVAAGMIMLAVLIYFGQIWGFIGRVIGVTMPFIIGGALAFLQLPVVRKLELFFGKYVFKRKPHPRLSRALSAILSLLFLLAILAAFLGILLPQVVDSIKSLATTITAFVKANAHHVADFLVQFDFISFEGDELIIAWENILNKTSNYIEFVVDNIMSIGSTIYTTIFQLFVGLIAAFYLLIDKDRMSAQAKKILYAACKKDTCESLIYWTRRANRIFAGFINGKIIDSVIIGALCYFGMLLFKIEYPVLISVIVGVTNIIPFFGPFIGAIPSVMILLIINPYSALWFTIFVLVLQQLDGNVIGPLILGDYVGISPLWIMISIVIGGGLFGFAGMLLSVPVFALVYAIIKAMIETSLKRKSLPLHSSCFTNAPEKIEKL